MRAYPIPYLTLLAVCIIILIGGIIGVSTTDRESPVSVQDAAFYMSWVPISVGAASILTLIFWIVGLVHALTNRALEGTDKLIWILVVMFLNGLGAVLYFFIAPNPAYRVSTSVA